MNNQDSWTTAPPTSHPPEGLPRPISMLVRRIKPKTTVSSHTHDWGQLVYASEGIISVRTPQGGYIVPPQRAVWVPPQIEHSVSTTLGAQLASIYIESQESNCLAKSCCVLTVSTLLQALILEAATKPARYEWAGTQGRLFRTLRDQVCEAEVVPLYLPMPLDSRLQKISKMLESDLSDNRSLEEWGALVGASSRTLSRLFSKETGMGFQRWRQQLRLQAAMPRLAQGETVTTVALSLGYESPSAFIAMFQQLLGTTPSEFFRS